MLQLEALRTWLLVVEFGSFTKVAAHLNISSTAISKQISQLEAMLGLTLVKRSTRHLEITEAGFAVYQQSKTILESVQHLTQFAAEQQTEPSGHLIVNSAIGIAKYLIAPQIPRFLAQYPKITITFNVRHRMPDFRHHAVDIAVGFPMMLTEAQETELVAKPFMNMTRILCASPSYLATAPPLKSYQDLCHHTYIQQDSRIADQVLLRCHQLNISIGKTLHVNNTEVLLQLILAGVGIGIIPKFMHSIHLHQKNLIQLLPDHQETVHPLYLFYRKTRYRIPKIAAFVTFLNEIQH